MSPRPFRMWCVVDPAGRFVEGTLKDTRSDATFVLFDFMPDPFRERYWKKADEAARAYRRLGYRTVKVEIREVES